MTTLYSNHSLSLRKRPFSFTEGFASAFDWSPVSRSYNVSPDAADARAIASDFIVTGNDMRAAVAE